MSLKSYIRARVADRIDYLKNFSFMEFVFYPRIYQFESYLILYLEVGIFPVVGLTVV